MDIGECVSKRQPYEPQQYFVGLDLNSFGGESKFTKVDEEEEQLSLQQLVLAPHDLF